jgi:hypothetical protein
MWVSRIKKYSRKIYKKCLCKPEAANTVRAPDDERYATQNMLSLQ